MKTYIKITVLSLLAAFAFTGCSSDKMAEMNRKHPSAVIARNDTPTEPGLAPVAEGPTSSSSPSWGIETMAY